MQMAFVAVVARKFPKGQHSKSYPKMVVNQPGKKLRKQLDFNLASRYMRGISMTEQYLVELKLKK